MIDLFCSILVNTLGLIHALLGLPFVIGVAIVIGACGLFTN